MMISFTPVDADIFLFDREELEGIASKETVGLGLSCFTDNRVLSVDSDENSLWASVEAEELDMMPYSVQVKRKDDGTLVGSCTCDCPNDNACRHLVAVLFAYGDLSQENQGLMSALDTAIKDRIKRAKSEVQVEPESGQPWFGSWRASSINAIFPRNYRVDIRSLSKRSNYCTCPDFSGNQLGTCKHIEAVLHKIQKHPDFEKISGQDAPYPYVYLSWEHEESPAVCLHRAGGGDPELENLLSEYFHADSTFAGRLPDDFFRFLELVELRDDIHVGEDAVIWANHQARNVTRQYRADRIRESIEATRGRLPGIKARLYPYQVTGTAFLAGTGRALLADDMGLGKTLQAIAAATWLKNNEGVQKILIICPASLKQQWQREIEKFTDLESQVIGGTPADRAVQYRQQVSIFILNYELVLRDLTLIAESCPDLIIMDEAQRIKNWRTKIATAVKLIPSRFAFVLTGTPLENRLEDLYSLMQVVDPKVLGPLWRYMVDFHVTDERGKVLGYRNLSLLRKRLAPVMLRRDRLLVKDQLPDRTVQRIDVSMTPKQVELHDDGLANAARLATIAKRRPLTPSEQNRLMASLQQARMACNSAGLVDKETKESPKVDELEALLEEICLQQGRKAVVFSQWERMTRLVEDRLKRMGVGYVRLHGGIPTAQRGSLIDSFRDDDHVQVFVSTDAGGVGLNLQSGSALINLDVPWNPAVLEQRNARVHRLGQKQKVQIVTMVAADSYEQQVMAIVNTKQDLFDNVVKEDASEDVVGVSKKLLETLIEDLQAEEEPIALTAGELPVPEDQRSVKEEGDQVQSEGLPVGERDTAKEEMIRSIIEELQNHCGKRIERIFGAQGGLICVLDSVDEESELLAVQLSERVPVALIDRFALQGLGRLGTASPLTGAELYYDQDEEADRQEVSKLHLIALEKFEAAKVLALQNMEKPALDLLVSAVLAKAGGLAGWDKPVAITEAGVWIYGEALPGGVITETEANLVMRGIGLNQAETLPVEIFSNYLQDASQFIEMD